MSAPTDQPKSPTPESPTTARPLELDDDDFQDANLNDENGPTKSSTATAAETSSTAAPASAGTTESSAGPGGAATTATGEELPAPPKPPRPLTEQQKMEQTLKEAFPTVELPVIKAVISASRGNIEAAFHALLEMTDPDAAKEEPAPPPQPPRPVQPEAPLSSPYLSDHQASTGRLSPQSQLVADEQLARELAQRYEHEAGAYEARTSSSGGYGPRSSSRGTPWQGPRPETGLKPNEMWGDKEHSFLEDDLPVIRENLRKGFVETQSKVNTWFTGFKKKLDDEWNIGGKQGDEYEDDDDDDDDDHQSGAGRHGPRQQFRTGGGRGGFGAPGGRPRRSGDYDADPELLSEDFAGIQLHGDGTPVRPTQPNLFRPPPPSGSERKVAFREGDNTTDIYSASPKLPPKDDTVGSGVGSVGSATKASKWQPLSAVDPAPMADNDPFSLGDSEDEKDAAAGAGKPAKDEAKPAASTSPEDAERLRKAAAEAMADSLVDDKKA